MMPEERPHLWRWQYVIALLAAVLGLGGAVVAVIEAQGSGDDSVQPATITTGTQGIPATTGGRRELPDRTDQVLSRGQPDPAPPSDELAPDALVRTTIETGQGDASAAGDTVTFHWVGRLADGTLVDSTWEQGGEPVTVTLGTTDAVPPWAEWLVDVRAGQRLRLEVGPENAWGVEGSGDGVVPPNAPVAFEVDVARIDGAPAPG
jgi:hypothetical protein